MNVPTLNEGEVYVGMIRSADGIKNHHIILLPGDIEDNWKKAGEWAASIGGALPDRVELALLYATLKSEFEKEWYWSSEQLASDSDFAWVQGFSNGGQGYDRKDGAFRARAVRRLPI